jgi:hypothetical protein
MTYERDLQRERYLGSAFADCLAYLAGRLAARLRGQLRHHSQRWSDDLACRKTEFLLRRDI